MGVCPGPVANWKDARTCSVSSFSRSMLSNMHWTTTLYTTGILVAEAWVIPSPRQPIRRAWAAIPKCAEASDTWPDVPWAQRVDWEEVPAQVLHRTIDHSSVTIVNEAPVWERILAHTQGGRVSPASAFLAPKGGCVNLCNEQERYTDYCTFQLIGEVEWLFIQTEEKQWKYRVAGDPST